MSATESRLSLAEAEFAARKFRELFPPETYVVWEVAGSVRRRKPDVGDIEHVVVPVVADLPGDDIFSSPVRTNLFFRHLDKLVAESKVTRHVRANGRTCWGGLHRTCDFQVLANTVHDVYLADAQNLGSQLAIFTGPGEFSKSLVTGLLRNGYRNRDGYVWWCETCGCNRYGPPCRTCDGTGLVPVQCVAVPDETAYFRLCGVPFKKPEDRHA